MNRPRITHWLRIAICVAVFVGVLGCTRNGAQLDALTIPVEAQPKGENFVKGHEILNESRKAYANLESYAGTIELTSAIGYQRGVPPQHVSKRVFKIIYKPPTDLRLEGPDSNNDPVTILVDGKSASVRGNGDNEQFDSATAALMAYSGVTLNASLFLPGCLLDIDWKNEASLLPKNKSFLTAWATKAKLNGTAQIEDHECHRIECERETVTFTIYIDTDSKLLRQVDHEVTEAQMKRLRNYREGGGASGRVISMSRSQTYVIDEVTWKTKPEVKNR